ncbi:MAG TPA: prolipoprotein diacylglyceryl transferase family protein [Pirellulales bacterium]|nr:prolipoprotein diacylglyceryl transferase family protein [Pirellulales bacterium]
MTWAYPAVMTAAVTTAYLLSRRRQKPLPLNAGQRLGLALGAFCGSMIGAKLPFVLSDMPGLLSGSAWFDNGKTIVFGLVGGYFGVELAKWALDIRIKTGDSFAVPVAVGVALGRLACFVGGCCYGVHTSLPWGVDFGDGPRHPTQLYETVFHLSAAAVLAFMEDHDVCRGQRIKLYIMAYLVYRLATEFIRPEPRLWWSLTGYQWACLACLPIFALLWLRDRRAMRTQG